MANPLACAAANASLDLFEREPRLEQVAAVSAQLRAELEPCRGSSGVADVRVLGAIGAVQLRAAPDREALKRAFLERGVWVRPFGDIVYLTPAFTITPDELSILTGAVVEVVRGLA
jgi:adenosylmethionine---8-amino-7-oxononanoate aminotransferase